MPDEPIYSEFDHLELRGRAEKAIAKIRRYGPVLIGKLADLRQEAEPEVKDWRREAGECGDADKLRDLENAIESLNCRIDELGEDYVPTIAPDLVPVAAELRAAWKTLHDAVMPALKTKIYKDGDSPWKSWSVSHLEPSLRSLIVSRLRHPGLAEAGPGVGPASGYSPDDADIHAFGTGRQRGSDRDATGPARHDSPRPRADFGHRDGRPQYRNTGAHDWTR